MYSKYKILLALISAIFLLSCSRDASIEEYFNISQRDGLDVIATNHELFSLDWSVAWLMSIDNKKIENRAWLVPSGYEKLAFSMNMSTKYQEVKEAIDKLFDNSEMDLGHKQIYIGGPDGNSYIGISENGRYIVYYRFKT